ncbi:hypothetical protein B0H15DRAFT_972734 [Mycena belliarum]|uniref:DUF7029 domain-containing protein n=1 Tax=Mycena belliarum TaxID=1033014 RepID=A0AAD6XWL2_9AGAR|nr:hypothetical protein B0H15DRAFT_972734 [Mycena belliae]
MHLLVYLNSLALASTVLFPLIAGHSPQYRKTGKPHSRPHVLHPTVHPAIDRSDPQHLRATTGLSLHYHDPHAAFPRIRSFASVHISEFMHPAVALEHSAHIVETICDSNASTITVQFRNRDAWAVAKDDWKTHPSAFLLAFSDSCGLGRESSERSIHRVRNMTTSWGKMEITFDMTETPLKDAIHPDRDVEIVINTFEVHDPRPGAAQSIGEQQSDDTDDSLVDDYTAPSGDDDDDSDIYASIYDSDGHIDYEVIAQLSQSWYSTSNLDGTVDVSAYEHFDPDDGFDEIDQDIPGFDPLEVLYSTDKSNVGRRGGCKLSWNPFAMLRNCILLPVVKIVVQTVPDSTSTDIVAVYKLLKAAITIVAALLSESGYTPSGEVAFDTNITLPMEQTQDFGYAYFVAGTGPLSGVGYSKGDHSFFKYESKFRFTLSNGFTDAEVQLVDGRLDFSAGIGILFDLSFSGTLAEKNFPTIPLSPLTIPGVITVGPLIQVTAGIGYQLNAKGKFLARNNIGWSEMTAKIDMLNGANSFIGEWKPTTPVPVVSLELEGSASIGPFVAAGLKFGVDILNGKLTVAAGLEVKASLPVGISAAIQAGTGMDTQFVGCQGFNVTLKTKIEIYVLLEASSVTLKRYDIIPPIELPIVDDCVQLSIAKTMNKLVPDVPLPILDAYYPGQVNRFITAQFQGGKSLQLIWLPVPDNNLYALPPLGEAGDSRYLINRLFVGSSNLSDTKATAGSYDNRVFYYDSKTSGGVVKLNSRPIGSYVPLRLASAEFVPMGAKVVALRMDADDSAQGPPFMGIIGTSTTKTTIGKYMFPVVCIHKKSERPAQLFAVEAFKHSDLAKVIKGIVTRGGKVRECNYVRFTIT